MEINAEITMTMSQDEYFLLCWRSAMRAFSDSVIFMGAMRDYLFGDSFENEIDYEFESLAEHGIDGEFGVFVVGGERMMNRDDVMKKYREYKECLKEMPNDVLEQLFKMYLPESEYWRDDE